MRHRGCIALLTLAIRALVGGAVPAAGQTAPEIDRPLIPPDQVTAPWWPADGQPRGLTRAAADYVKARPARDNMFTFCVVGDSNNPGLLEQPVKPTTQGEPKRTEKLIRPISRVFAAVIDEANKRGPDFIIQVGDQAYVGREWEFEGTLDAYSRSRAPILTVPGNHDKQANTGAYQRIFGDAPYTFDHGGVRFVMLDRMYAINQKTMDWLDEKLAWDGPKVVVMHIPPWIDYYPSPSPMLSAYGVEGRDSKAESFKALMARRKVDIVFMGHIHCYDRHEADNVRWIICAQAHGANYAALNQTPGVWEPREIRPERKGKTQNVPHFVEVRVENGKLTDTVHLLAELNKLDYPQPAFKMVPLPPAGPPKNWWKWWDRPATQPAGKD